MKAETIIKVQKNIILESSQYLSCKRANVFSKREKREQLKCSFFFKCFICTQFLQGEKHHLDSWSILKTLMRGSQHFWRSPDKTATYLSKRIPKFLKCQKIKIVRPSRIHTPSDNTGENEANITYTWLSLPWSPNVLGRWELQWAIINY